MRREGRIMRAMAKPVTYNATLVERVDLTSALTIFKIRPDDALAGDPPFIPGQYVTLGMNNEERPDLGSVRRPMSVVSAPQEKDFLEFYIRYVSYPESDNPLTHLMWKANAGDRMFMRTKPAGNFTIEDMVGEDDKRLRICVAAGTGLAPFVSMVRTEYLANPSVDLSHYVILHGASYPADLGYREELEKLQADCGLRYYTSISRPQQAPDWNGDCGRVEDYFLPDRLESLEQRMGLPAGGLTPDRATILICGLQGTIGETITRLTHRGFVPENRRLRRSLEAPEDMAPTLFFEQYDNTPPIDVKDPAVMDPLRAQLRAALAQS